jgi:hypothetical protein
MGCEEGVTSYPEISIGCSDRIGIRGNDVDSGGGRLDI